MYALLKRLLPHDLRQSLKRKLFVVQDMRARLENLQRSGFVPTGFIDAGAYQGDWTREAWNIWPSVPCMLVEPLPEQAAALSELARRVPGSKAISKALSSRSGSVSFRLGETNSGISLDAKQGETIDVQCTTLDELIREHTLFSPNLLKLDLQGHELEALRGAQSSLGLFEVIILEISILQIGEVPIFREVDRFMEERGYRMYDAVPQYYRPLDGALWQIDAFYVREKSALIASRAWE